MTNPDTGDSHSVLRVRNLKTYFDTDRGLVKSVDGVSFDIGAGQTLAVVGESGSGKSVTSLSIMGLLDKAHGRVVDGSITFRDKKGRVQDLCKASEASMRKIRGSDISMIFQEPMSSLNPVFTIGDQIAEAIILHQGLSRAAARNGAIEMLRIVGIPAPEKRVDQYPHQMSGGMRQRVMIAMALSCRPTLLIADEPTTALDVTIQAQILDLMKRLQQEIGMSILFITHDLGVVAEVADRVAVMYGGLIVEEGDVVSVLTRPTHPYTIGLLDSVPGTRRRGDSVGARLYAIPGNVPDPRRRTPGCPFAPRCSFAIDACRADLPPLVETGTRQAARCIRWQEAVAS
ncbi:peptide ABC transporter ATP-binding protein [Devosia sp. 17-2-E-8]|nr:peptide ABC transporter ATP-binding protein [Devosia sp. 17-2-E-8]